MGVSSRVAALFALLVLAAFPAAAEQRLALVIGNNDYPSLSADEQLRKAINDANAVGDALEVLGFEVTRGENLSRSEMLTKLFATRARLQRGDLAFFFFAGHGVAINGANYLLPSDIPSAEAGGEELVQESAITEAKVIQELQSRGVRVAMVVLDACRNNPFNRGGTRSVGDATRGLVRSSSAEAQGVFSLYSAGFGEAALDRLGDDDENPNSVFTRVLVPELMKPGQSLIDVTYTVQEKVSQLAESVGHEQNPAYYDQSRARDIFLAGQAADESERAIDVVGTSCESARLHFDAARASNRVEALRDHVARFGHCEFASLARILIEQMEGEQVANVTPDGLGDDRTQEGGEQSGAARLDPNGTANAFVRALAGGTPVLDGGMTKGAPFNLTFETARREGADIMVEGLRIRETDGSFESLIFARTIITAPTTTAEGNLKSPRIELLNGTFEYKFEDESPVPFGSLGSFAITDFATVTRLMSGPGAGAFGYVFGSMDARNLELKDRDTQMISVERASLEAQGFVGGQPRSIAGRIDGISLARAVFKGEDLFELLGYDPFVLEVSWETSRDFASGTYAVDSLSIALENGGVLSATASARGVPPLSLALQSLATQDILRLLSIELESLSVRYEDDSLADELLDALAVWNLKESRADMIQEAIHLMQSELLLDPVFELKTAPLLADFMLEPRSFSVEIAPEEPLSIAKIGEIIASAPETLHEELGVSFSVNAPQ